MTEKRKALWERLMELIKPQEPEEVRGLTFNQKVQYDIELAEYTAELAADILASHPAVNIYNNGKDPDPEGPVDWGTPKPTEPQQDGQEDANDDGWVPDAGEPAAVQSMTKLHLGPHSNIASDRVFETGWYAARKWAKGRDERVSRQLRETIRAQEENFSQVVRDLELTAARADAAVEALREKEARTVDLEAMNAELAQQRDALNTVVQTQGQTLADRGQQLDEVNHNYATLQGEKVKLLDIIKDKDARLDAAYVEEREMKATISTLRRKESYYRQRSNIATRFVRWVARHSQASRDGSRFKGKLDSAYFKLDKLDNEFDDVSGDQQRKQAQKAKDANKMGGTHVQLNGIELGPSRPHAFTIQLDGPSQLGLDALLGQHRAAAGHIIGQRGRD